MFENLRTIPDVFVTYTNISKLGINPQPIDKTSPLGIYAYSLKQSWDDVQARSLPFSHRQYAYAFRMTGYLNLARYQHSDYNNDIVTLVERYGKAPFFQDADGIMEFIMRNERSKIAESIWEITRALSRRIAILSKRPAHVVWNSVWRTLGYTGVYDAGLSIIHKLEPQQAVFFSRSGIEILDMEEQ